MYHSEKREPELLNFMHIFPTAKIAIFFFFGVMNEGMLILD